MMMRTSLAGIISLGLPRCTCYQSTAAMICELVVLCSLLAAGGAQSLDDITEIRLVGGPAHVPNSGRVEALHGSTGIWLNVCDVNFWGDNDGEVACRQLGFPGYSRTRRASYFGEGTNNGSVGGIGCNGGEDSLGQCPHNPVQESTRCEGRVAGLICTAPGFLGCFNDNRGARVFTSPRLTADNMTIGLCLDHCRSQGLRYAGLENRRDCYCGDAGTQIGVHGQKRDKDCKSACMGNADEVCGGGLRLSIYDLNLGYCTDPGTPADGGREPPGGEAFRYGANVTFFCNDGFELEGEDSARCVLGDSPQEVTWDEALPQCRYLPMSTTGDPGPGDDSQRGGDGAGKIAGITVACLILFVLLILLVVFVVRKRRRKDKNANKTVGVQEGNAYSDPHHTARYQTSAGPPSADTEYQDLASPSADASADTEYQDLASPSADADRPYTSLKKHDPQRASETDIPEYLELDEYTSLGREEGGGDLANRPVGAQKAATRGKQQPLPSPEINENEYSYVDASGFSSNDKHKPEEYAELDSVYYSLPPDTR